ncbi:DUF1308 domain-containing protein [Massilia antarctica]|uniref:DUF1308 domain-containing protein n=2 Tax=Massilia antarctica TaxID=2765360 RepID=A0AA48WD47_9BURK|nr:DUF1308 domain-containing protein [Massilia antarctica]
MIMTETTAAEFTNIYSKIGGTKEAARAQRFMEKVKIVPDNLSVQAQNLKVTNSVGANDIKIFGTADQLGIQTLTSDAKFLRGTKAQGVDFDAYLHPPVSLTGQ